MGAYAILPEYMNTCVGIHDYTHTPALIHSVAIADRTSQPLTTHPQSPTHSHTLGTKMNTDLVTALAAAGCYANTATYVQGRLTSNQRVVRIKSAQK